MFDTHQLAYWACGSLIAHAHSSVLGMRIAAYEACAEKTRWALGMHVESKILGKCSVKY